MNVGKRSASIYWTEVQLMPADEVDLLLGKINWLSLIERALTKAKVDDSTPLRTPSGVEKIDAVAIHYGACATPAISHPNHAHTPRPITHALSSSPSHGSSSVNNVTICRYG